MSRIPSPDPPKSDGLRAIHTAPAVAQWELWSVANMLVTAHGDAAEEVARGRLQDAEHRAHEGDMLVWQGVITQIQRIRCELPGTRPA